MFIHAVEAEIFNKALEERIKANDFETGLSFKQNFYGFPDSNSLNAGNGGFSAAPLIGYETKETEISSYEQEILENMHISKSDFKIKSLPQLSMKGAYRSLFSPIKDASYAVEDDNSVNVSFSIPAGSYATILMGEITKTNNSADSM
jgi:tRNA pseudouridine13 synthase